jgi:hypothetical protein
VVKQRTLEEKFVMEQLDPPACLKRAREEILIALAALRPEDEDAHRTVAEDLMLKAVRSIWEHPELKYDWTRLSPSRENLH